MWNRWSFFRGARGKGVFREHVNVVVPCCHYWHPDGCLVEVKSRCLRSKQSALLSLVVEGIFFFIFFILFFIFSLDAAWPGQDRTCISTQQPRLLSMSCLLILFAALNAVPLISSLLYWNTKPSLSIFPPPPPLSLSHFLLEGKKHKIRFLEPVCVCMCVFLSVKKKKKRQGNNRQLRALDWVEKWLGPLKEINDLH